MGYFEVVLWTVLRSLESVEGVRSSKSSGRCGCEEAYSLPSAFFIGKLILAISVLLQNTILPV